jgi:hypothetical protein
MQFEFFRGDFMNCPNCNSSKVISIIYGDPDETLIENANNGEIFLGGCIRKKERNYCKNCKSSF